ncbi:NosD domain-containing protein [Commensalibacter nepenthis]|uniref:Periplasmic copper-binding protein NosD beta helix domain-containing protein n=1 Tax=Commensalibacter nepenthis TaxID=3043872 RepID=A0ABT6Q6Y4_9PROT|nr:NosD domain-containing protein [Commensalibacter sp. TBRC 10068]MDI2112110.1 hypothetical protein [Commensalibacter sp. TBRC 10068]
MQLLNLGQAFIYLIVQLNSRKIANVNQSITIRGQGKGVTRLLWNDQGSGAGIGLSHTDIGNGSSRYNIYDLSLVTKGNSRSTCLNIVNNSSNIFGGYLSMRGVAITGYGGQASGNAGWVSCLTMIGISFNNIVDCDFIGNNDNNSNYSVGVSVLSQHYDSNTVNSIVTNITDCIFLRLMRGVENKIDTQGLTISQSNFTNCQTGVYVPDNGYQIGITNSQFDCYYCAVLFDGGTTCFLFSNNLVFTRYMNTFGIACNAYIDGYIITGNQFEGNGSGYAIMMHRASPQGLDTNIISNNIIRKYAVGITLDQDTRGWKVFGNAYASNSSNILNQGRNNTISN